MFNPANFQFSKCSILNELHNIYRNGYLQRKSYQTVPEGHKWRARTKLAPSIWCWVHSCLWFPLNLTISRNNFRALVCFYITPIAQLESIIIKKRDSRQGRTSFVTLYIAKTGSIWCAELAIVAFESPRRDLADRNGRNGSLLMGLLTFFQNFSYLLASMEHFVHF